MKTRAALGVSILIVMLSASPALAQTDGTIGGGHDDSGVGDFEATVTGDGDGDDSGGDGGSDGSSGGVPYLETSGAWSAHYCTEAASWQEGFFVRRAVVEKFRLDDGRILDAFEVWCMRGPGDVALHWDFWFDPGADPGVEAVAIRTRLLADLKTRVVAPKPVIATSPPLDGTHIVGIWAWFWVDPSSFETQSDTESDSAGLTITLSAVPGELRFFPGDDAVTGNEAIVTCVGPGLAWRRGMDDLDSDCRHFWDWPSKHAPTGQFVTRAEVDYEFVWTATGTLARWLPATSGTLDPSPTTITSDDTPVTVIELQAVIG